VWLLLLLFTLALYEFATAGFTPFAIICLIPVIALVVLASFQYRLFLFWTLIVINYIIQWHSFPTGSIPLSLPNELLEILLLSLAILDTKEAKFERCANMMLYALMVWCGFCTLQVLNDTCGIGVDVGAWYSTARSIAFQIMYAFLVYTLYITNPKILVKYLFLWGALALFAAFWVWKQKYIGFTAAENSFIQGRGRTTHIIQGGSLIRYFSIYSDAANFGIGIASLLL
jgi:hypothetical protein